MNMRLPLYRFALILGLAVFFLVGIKKAEASTDSLIEWAQSTYSYVESVPDAEWIAGYAKNQLLDKLSTAIGFFEDGKIAQGVQLIDTVLIRFDGCMYSDPPAPDENDWMINCATSNAVGNELFGLSCAGGGNGIASITIYANNTELETDSPAEQFVAVGELNDTPDNPDCGGATVSLTSQVSWASSDSSVAGIGSDGLLTPLAAGSTDVSATMADLSSNVVTVTVSEAVPPRIYIGSYGSYYTVDLSAERGGRSAAGPYSIGGYPNAIDFSSGASKLFVTDYPNKTVQIVDPSTNSLFSGSSGLISLGDLGSNYLPRDLDYSRNAGIFYVAAGNSKDPSTGKIIAYDDAETPAQRFIQSSSATSIYTELTVCDAKNKVYAIAYDDNAIVALDADTGDILSTIDIGGDFVVRLVGLMLSPTAEQNYLYVAAAITSEVIVIDTSTDSIVHRYSLPGNYLTQAIPSADETKVYALSLTGTSAYVVNMSDGSTLSTIPLSGYSYMGELSSDGSELYVQSFPYSIKVIDTSTDAIVETIASPGMVFTMKVVDP